MQICPKCGQVYEGNQCRVCVAREADIEKTFFPCLWVATAGVLGTMFASAFYPPLEGGWLVVYSLVVLIFIPIPIGIVFVYWQRLTRYAGLFRLIIFLIAAAFFIPATYYCLNGALDRNPPVVVQAVVSRKSKSDYNLGWGLSWNGKRIEQVCGVSHEMFSAVEPGDAVLVVVHPGAFSHPWFSSVRPWGSRAGDSR